MLEHDVEREFKIYATLADLHIGNKAISPEEYKYQLKHGVIHKLEQLRFLDGIIICGDTTHYQISLNSEYSNVLSWFISKLIKIGKKHGAFIRIIKGTRSHDLEQLESLRHYEDDDEIDFKIINTKCVEVIDGYRYGYIPEECIDEKPNKYYSEFYDMKNDYFDLIFGHGTVKECQFFEQESENITSKAPLIDTDRLMRVCRGPISFGHIHTPTNIKDKFFYIGSCLRTCHGEEHDKGWNVVCYVKKSGLYRVDKIVNEYTFNFNTLKLDNMFISQNDVDNIIIYIENYIEKYKTDRLSIKVNCVEERDNILKIQVLKKYLANDKRITSTFKILTEQAYERDMEIENNKITKPYLAKGLDIVQQIQLWALDKRSIRLDEKDIRRFITADTLNRKGV